MKVAIFLPILLLLGADPGPEQPRQAKLMDSIERNVRLPKGAESLAKYARYYVFQPDGKVSGIYVIPDPAEPHPDWACEEIGEDGKGRVVPCPPMRPWPEDGGVAGQRRWVANQRALPFMCDGGCRQVTILFDPATGKLDSWCNGHG